MMLADKPTKEDMRIYILNILDEMIAYMTKEEVIAYMTKENQ